MPAIDGVRRSGVAVSPHRSIRDAAMIMDQASVDPSPSSTRAGSSGSSPIATWCGADWPRILDLPHRSRR
jgi:hypothetical protein